MTVYVEGADHLCQTISTHFFHPHLLYECKQQVNASQIHQCMWVGHCPYGPLASCDANLFPWHDVHIDTTGPWSIKVNGIDSTYQALTSIDPVYNLLEIAHVKDKTSEEAAHVFNNTWLSHYPCPTRCIHDNGPEFKDAFQDLLLASSIKPIPVTPHN